MVVAGAQRGHYACVSQREAPLEFPETFLDDLSRILRSESVSLMHPGKTTKFLDQWTLVAGRWQDMSHANVELDVTNAQGDAVCVEVRAENFQRELAREESTDGSDTAYDELIADISSLLQELLIPPPLPKPRASVSRPSSLASRLLLPSSSNSDDSSRSFPPSCRLDFCSA